MHQQTHKTISKNAAYRIPYANSRDGERQNPHSKILCDERGYDFHPDKKNFCPPTPEALEVVKSFHWGAYFVVFSDGSVYATKSVEDGNCGWFAGVPLSNVNLHATLCLLCYPELSHQLHFPDRLTAEQLWKHTVPMEIERHAACTVKHDRERAAKGLPYE